MYKWGSITFGIGILLVIIEIYFAAKKKDGIQPSDKQRIWGIFWLTCFATALVMGLIWAA
jgi:hypothetical protein